jgi:hypothetical protein
LLHDFTAEGVGEWHGQEGQPTFPRASLVDTAYFSYSHSLDSLDMNAKNYLAKGNQNV